MADHNCRHLLDDLSDFVTGEAAAAVCAEVERHLADCENCRVVVDTLRRTIQLYHDLPQPGLPAGARERLYRSLELQAFLGPVTS